LRACGAPPPRTATSGHPHHRCSPLPPPGLFENCRRGTRSPGVTLDDFAPFFPDAATAGRAFDFFDKDGDGGSRPAPLGGCGRGERMQTWTGPRLGDPAPPYPARACAGFVSKAEMKEAVTAIVSERRGARGGLGWEGARPSPPLAWAPCTWSATGA
jgi:hypothetical protein